MFKYFDHLTDLQKTVIGYTGLWGWLYGLTLLNVSPMWEYILKGFGGVIFAAIGVLFSLLITDIYKHKIKDKLFKTNKDAKQQITTDNEKRA